MICHAYGYRDYGTQYNYIYTINNKVFNKIKDRQATHSRKKKQM